MRIAVMLFLIATMQSSNGVAQDGSRSDRREWDDRRGQRNENTDSVIETGYVFIDGQYIRPPYRIQYSESQVSVNEFAFDLSVFLGWVNENKKRRRGSRGDHGRRIHRNLWDLLEANGSVVLFEDKPIQAFAGNGSYELLNVLIDAEARQEFSEGERSWLPSGVDEAVWARWIREFECPEELSERAEEMLTRIEQAITSNASQISARRTLESTAYPLTVVGMLLVVMAFGHLLSFKPGSGGHSPETRLAKRAVIRSLALVTVLSALDLIWTLLVSRAGDMKELNPLGAAVIDDPLALIALKTTATLLAVGLLFGLRRHRVAQQGAWWACLICTLLTVRWLTFNSMFA